MAGTLAVAIICPVSSLVSGFAQVAHFYHSRKNVPRWRRLAHWSLVQFISYVLSSVVTIVVWQLFKASPNISSIAFQCFMGICLLNSLIGQYFLVFSIFRDSDRASLVNGPFFISILAYILGFGFSQSSSVNLVRMGVSLAWCSTLIFYTVVGIAVRSTFLTISLPTSRNTFFMAVFIIAALGLLVLGIVTLGKDDPYGLLLGLAVAVCAAHLLLTGMQFVGWLSKERASSQSCLSDAETRRVQSLASVTRLASRPSSSFQSQASEETKA